MHIGCRLAALALALVGSIMVPATAGAAVFLNQWGGGSIGFIVDGTSNTIAFTEQSRVAICVDRVGFSVPLYSIMDGTSNTIAFTETAPWSLHAGFVRPRQPISAITDGTSNTIVLGETPTDALCLGDGSVIPAITDGTSNTILFGEESSFDICVSHARLGTIVDGTSNTILFGEVMTDPVCYAGARVLPAVAGVVAEPATIVLTGMAFAGLGFVGRRRLA
jgi:hypothetical protein